MEIYRLLDRRVFGGLKANGRAKRRMFDFEQSKSCDIAIAAALPMESWEEWSESITPAGWNFNEAPAELESVASSNDDEFKFLLNSDSDEWDKKCLNLGPEGKF
jgi:hypothetical protein